MRTRHSRHLPAPFGFFTRCKLHIEAENCYSAIIHERDSELRAFHRSE
jgi:hypothetical protein